MELIAGASGSFEMVPNDGADLPEVTAGFLIATDGALRVTWENGVEAEYPAGTWATQVMHVGRLRKVWATGTDATGLWAFTNEIIGWPPE